MTPSSSHKHREGFVEALRVQRRVRFLLGHLHELLTIVLARPGVPADSIVARFFADRRYLGSHDRGFIADALYAILRGVLRHRVLLERHLVPDALDRAASQHIVAWLDEEDIKLPADQLAAILNLSVTQVEAIAPLLRDGRARVERIGWTERSAIMHGLPLWFMQEIVDRVGIEDAPDALAAFDRQAPIALRTNRLITSRHDLRLRLERDGVAAQEGRYSPDALLLKRRLNAHGLPEFRQGMFEVQDEGSQMLSIILDPHPHWRVFDACAGGGGKTLHMAAIMRGKGEVWAHDINPRRLADIRPRLKRSGAQNVRIASHEHYLQMRSGWVASFDAVMIDAPCSGLGVLRRNPGARLTIDTEAVNRLVELQATILTEYSRLVRPGGLLLYATCSLMSSENENQIEQFLAREVGWTVEPISGIEPTMITREGYYRSWPHLHDTDAFFGALLRFRVE